MFYLIFKFFSGVQLIYSILCQFLLYSKVNLLVIYIYPQCLKIFFPHIGYYRALSRVSCAIYCVCVCMCVCVCTRVRMCTLSQVRLFANPQTIVHQAPLSMGFSRKEYWTGQPFPFPGDPLDPRLEPKSPSSQADSLPSEPQENTCYTVVGLFSYLFYTQWYVYVNPNHLICLSPLFSFGNHKFVLYIFYSILVLYFYLYLFFQILHITYIIWFCLSLSDFTQYDHL